MRLTCPERSRSNSEKLMAGKCRSGVSNNRYGKNPRLGKDNNNPQSVAPTLRRASPSCKTSGETVHQTAFGTIERVGISTKAASQFQWKGLLPQGVKSCSHTHSLGRDRPSGRLDRCSGRRGLNIEVWFLLERGHDGRLRVPDFSWRIQGLHVEVSQHDGGCAVASDLCQS